VKCNKTKVNILRSGVVVALLLSVMLLPQAPTVKATEYHLVSWSKYPADNVTDVGSPGAWDDTGVGAACVIKDGDTYKMWYTGYNATGVLKIGYAYSDDGIIWTKYGSNPVLISSASGWDDEGVGSPCVIIAENGTYQMWYTGYKENGDNVSRIGYAESTDNGITWSPGTLVSDLSPGAGEWDERGVHSPWVINDGGTYKMWYTGRGGTGLIGNWAVGYAESIDNGTTWTEPVSNPVLSHGTSGAWDDKAVGDVSVIKYGGTYYMWYTGYAGSGSGNVAIGSISSSSATDWDNAANAILTKGASGWNSGGVGAPSVWLESSTKLRMWYSGLDGSIAPRVGRAYWNAPSPPPAGGGGGGPPPPPPLTPEKIERMLLEEAAEKIEEAATNEAAEVLELVTTQKAAEIIELLTTQKAADIIKLLTTQKVMAIIENLTTQKAAEIIDLLTTSEATEIIDLLTTSKAAKIIELLHTQKAADIIELLTTPRAAEVLENVAVKKAAAIMQEMTLSKLIEIIQYMSEESLIERLSEVLADKVHEIPPTVLFEALPNAPTEQLVREVPPAVDPDLPVPTMISPTHYRAASTKAGKWVTIVGSPSPIKKINIKTSEALEDVETTIKELLVPPQAAELPSGSRTSSPFIITLKNITPEQMLIGHMTFVVEKTWIEQNNINKWSIFLNRYDEEAKKWTRLPTMKKDETYESVYYNAAINDFSPFAITGSSIVPPLGFGVSKLSISPDKVPVGESVTITADIKNELGVTDTYVASLWVNSTIEDMRYLTLAKGETATVSFSVAKDKVGSYQVRIGRQMGSFEVQLPPPPPPPPVVVKPAKFEVSQLSISPAEAEVGRTVIISARVTNIGEAEGSYEAVLKIDGIRVAPQKVTLGGGKSTKAVFSVTKNVAATYLVEIDGQRSKLTVIPKPVPAPKPVPWWPLAVGVVVIGLLIFLLATKRRRY